MEVINNDIRVVEIEKTSILKNTTIESVENKIILAYSLKKISTKPTEAYSTLNPETSSDSPSAKSKGVRLVSASRRTTQIMAVRGTTLRLNIDAPMWSFKFILINKTINCIITRDNLIS